MCIVIFTEYVPESLRVTDPGDASAYPGNAVKALSHAGTSGSVELLAVKLKVAIRDPWSGAVACVYGAKGVAESMSGTAPN
jgi:hypothetical protein